jgi:hypothetical protein
MAYTPVCVLEIASLKLAALMQLSALVFARPAADAWANATAYATTGGSLQLLFFKGYDLFIVVY